MRYHISQKGIPLVVLIILAVCTSGCTNQPAGTGVEILHFGPDFERVYPGEIVNFRVRIQNRGSVEAGNVFAELLGLDEDWFDESREAYGGGPWKGTEKLPNEPECRYTEEGKHRTLIPPDPVFGTGGETMTCTWTYKAPGPEYVPRGMERKYPITVRVFYDYHTEVVKVLTLVSKKEIKTLQEQGKSIPLGDMSSTRSPVMIDVVAETPIRLSAEEIEFPITINIRNVGGGTACLRGLCKKPKGGEWNKIKMRIDSPEGMDLGECEEYRNLKEITLTKGRENSIKCYVRIENPWDIGFMQKTLRVYAEYSYFIDGESQITVGY